MTDLTVVIIEIGDKNKSLLEKCLEKVCFRLHNFETFLGNPDEIVGKIQAAKKKQLQMFEVSIQTTYYFKIENTGEMITILKEEAYILIKSNAILVTGENFLEATFLEKK